MAPAEVRPRDVATRGAGPRRTALSAAARRAYHGRVSAPTRPPHAPTVARERAVDPRTGLPVVRFVGPHAPTLQPGAPAPAGAWRVLHVQEREGTWTVELETSATARPLAEVAATVDDDDVDEVIAVLEDAERLGVIHGALALERFWRHGVGVRIEGFGVGWGVPDDPTSDRAAAARALLDLPGTAISAVGRARLATWAGVAATPVAAEQAAAAAEAAAPETAAPEAAAQEAAAPETSPPVATADPTPPRAPVSPPMRTAEARPTPTADTPPSHDARAPRPPTSAAAPDPLPVPATFVKAPPPGARVRPGGSPLGGLPSRAAAAVARAGATPDGRRRLRLGAALLVGVALLATLSVALQRRPAVAVPSSGATAYVVDVQVSPGGLPPARLVVLSSPPGSRLTPGTVVGSVPRMVQLDREGTWRFEARFLERRSEPATLRLPEERTLVLVFPEPEPAAR